MCIKLQNCLDRISNRTGNGRTWFQCIQISAMITIYFFLLSGTSIIVQYIAVLDMLYIIQQHYHSTVDIMR